MRQPGLPSPGRRSTPCAPALSRRLPSRYQTNGGDRRGLRLGPGCGHAAEHGRGAGTGAAALGPQPYEPRGPAGHAGRRGGGQHTGRHRRLCSGVPGLRREHHSRRGNRGAAEVPQRHRDLPGGPPQIRRRSARHQRLRRGGLLLHWRRPGPARLSGPTCGTSAVGAWNWWASSTGAWRRGTPCLWAASALPTASG